MSTDDGCGNRSPNQGMGLAMTLNPGDRFGDYTVVKLLGKDGMGAVC